jgi:hypothetical protein
MDDQVVAALVGAVAGAGLAYVVDLRRAAADRKRAAETAAAERRQQQAAVATALIADLRALEPVLTQLFRHEKAGLWHGKRFALFFNELRSETTMFNPAAVYAVSDFFRLVDDLFGVLEQEQASGHPNKDAGVFHHTVRTKAGFALQAIAAAKAALVAEGGVIPASTALPVIYYPDLPVIPPPSFPDVAPPK